MKKAFLLKIVFLTIILSQPAVAIGWQFGVGGGYTYLEAQKSADVGARSPFVGGFNDLSLYALYTVDRDQRWLFDASSQSYSTGIENSRVTQDGERTAFGITYQRRFVISDSFKPWGGIGLFGANERFRNRRLIDDAGFITTNYPNADRSGGGVQFDITIQPVFYDSLIFRSVYFVPLGYTGTQGLKFSLAWFYGV